MIAKDDMRNLMHLMAEFLKSKGLSDEEILGSITVMKANAVASGIYKDDTSEESN